MQFSTAFALIFHACSASGALASSDHADPASGFETDFKRGWRVGKFKRSEVADEELCFLKCAELVDAKGTPICTGTKWRQKSNKPCRVFRGARSGSCGNLHSNPPLNRDKCWEPTRAYLQAEFPDLGPLASEATVAAYTEQVNTMTRSSGIVFEVWRGTPAADDLSWFDSTAARLDTRAGGKISKSEATLLCVTKCEEVLPGCTMFGLNEYATVDGEVYHMCYFYGDGTATAQFPVETPFSFFKDSEGNAVMTTAMVVFHKGEELALPEFDGCDVPLSSDVLNSLIMCRVLKFGAALGGAALSQDCEDLLLSASDDFEAYIWPGVQCTFAVFGYDGGKLNECLLCLSAVGEANNVCGSGKLCGEDLLQDSFITNDCSDDCPAKEVWGVDCVSEVATSFLCRYGAAPTWNADVVGGSCMNSDTPPDYTYLADFGNGDYKCPPPIVS